MVEKTVVYTIPCLMNPGILIIISPLVMLMYDQVERLSELGIDSCYYNSLLSADVSLFLLFSRKSAYFNYLVNCFQCLFI